MITRLKLSKTIFWSFVSLILIASLILSTVSFHQVLATTNQGTIYSDSLVNGWVNWSWGVSSNFSTTNPVYDGNESVRFTPSAWSALYFHTDTALDLNQYHDLQFALESTQGTPKFKVLFYDSNNQLSSTQLDLENFGQLTNGTWKIFSIPVSAIPLQQIKGFALQDVTGQNQSPLFIDSIQFISSVPTLTPTPSPTPMPTPLPTRTPSPITTTQNINSYSFYSDALTQGWNNWSWGSTVNLSASTAYSGQKSIALTTNAPWSALYLHNDSGINTTGFTTLHLAIKPTGTNEKFGIALYDSNNQSLSGFQPLTNFGQLNQNSWTTIDIPLSNLNALNKTIHGLAIQEALGQSQPPIYLDDLSLTGIASTSTPTTTPTSSPAAASPIGFTTTNNIIYQNGTPIQLHGINWFGAETTNYVQHGLWARNWKDMIAQIKSLGFNAVRMPVCPQTLQGTTPVGIDYSKNVDLSGLNSSQILDKVITELNNQHLNILVDHHRPDCQAISELWYTGGYSETQWINDLTSIAKRYQSLPYFMGIDLKNEPHGQATWGTGNTATDWNKAAERAGSAVLAANPNILVFVEGVGENPVCSSTIGHFWGENLEAEKCNPISTAAIPAQKLVLSPHVYGPDAYQQSYFNDPNFPNNMPSIWDTQFGSLTTAHTITLGEWGGKMGTNGGSSQDLTYQKALTTYLTQKHICNSFYWSLNPNSGDTGGVLADDWTSVWPTKINLIQAYFQNCK